MKKTTNRILWASGILALLALAGFLAYCSLRDTLESQNAAERWAGEGEARFAQLSCFMSQGDQLSLEDIDTFRTALANALIEASIEAPEYGRAFSDCWSTFTTLDVTGETGSGAADVTAVGGNFYLFHPLRLLSGSFIGPEDVMDDRVVLDRELAWRLFGGVDLTGMTVTIAGVPFTIAGVVERDTDRFSKAAQAEGMGMYLSYSALETLRGGASTEEEGGVSVPIDCYELVMPQPVAGYAEGILKNRFPLGGGELRNNSDRFRSEQIRGILKEFGTRSMHRNSVIYPFWENAARGLEDWCALCLFLAMFFAVVPGVVALVGLLFLLIQLKNYLVKKIPALVSGAVERGRKRRWNRRAQ